MPHITTCTRCGRAYEEVSEEAANHPSERLCLPCYRGRESEAPRGPTRAPRAGEAAEARR